jgi:hypothetical protein
VPVVSNNIYVCAKTFKFTYKELKVPKPPRTDSFAKERKNINIVMIGYFKMKEDSAICYIIL